MKYTTFIWVTALSFALTACGGDAPKDEKKDEKPTEKVEDKKSEPEKAEALTEEGKKIAKTWMLKEIVHLDGKKDAPNGVFKLNADGTFEELIGGKQVASGTWNLKDKVLSMKHLTGDLKEQIEKLTIKEATDKKLVTTDLDGKMTETYEAK